LSGLIDVPGLIEARRDDDVEVIGWSTEQ